MPTGGGQNSRREKLCSENFGREKFGPILKKFWTLDPDNNACKIKHFLDAMFIFLAITIVICAVKAIGNDQHARREFQAKTRLEQASRDIDSAGVRSRAIERRLRTVESLPMDQAARILGEDPAP